MKNLYILALILLFISCGGNAQEIEENTSELMKAPVFTLMDLNGESVSLTDYSDKTVLVVFWATWCPHCKAEIPKLKEIHEKYKDKDFTILALNVGENPEKLKEFVEKNNIDYKVLYDKDTEIARLYGVLGIPAHFVVDTEGNGYFYGEFIDSAMAKTDTFLNIN